MKAVWYEQIGAADEVLRHGNIDDPELNDGEILVRIRTSGVNPSDVKTRGGARNYLGLFPILMGLERLKQLAMVLHLRITQET